MFVKEDHPVEKDNTAATFKRAAALEALTKQKRMQNDIDPYNKAQVKPKIAVRINPDFPIIHKTMKKSTKVEKKSTSKLVIAELGKRVEKYDLIDNLANTKQLLNSPYRTWRH